MSKLRSPAALFSSTMGTRPDRLRCWPRRYWNDLDKLLGIIEVNIFVVINVCLQELCCDTLCSSCIGTIVVLIGK